MDLEAVNCSLVRARIAFLAPSHGSCKSIIVERTLLSVHAAHMCLTLATVCMPLQDDIVREAQTMRRLHHPNVLLLHVSFVHKQMLWMVEPYIAGGSMLNIMKYAYPEASSWAVTISVHKCSRSKAPSPLCLLFAQGHS